VKWRQRQAELERLRKHTPKWKNPLPDLTVEQRVSPTSDRFAPTMGKRELPRGAKQFPVGNNHKQGTELITEGMSQHLQFLGGKKT
jgi:hypothetical protein